MFAAYERVLMRRPMAMKTALGFATASVGDGTAQCVEQRGRDRFQYDAVRGAAITSFGAAWHGPFMHTYIGFLERTFPQRRFGAPGAVWTLLSKTALTQLITNPFIYLPAFYSWTGYVYGRSFDETMEKVRREYLSSLQATWLIFTPVNLLNFYFTPARHQVSVSVAVSFLYNTTLSLISAPRPADVTNRLSPSKP